METGGVDACPQELFFTSLGEVTEFRSGVYLMTASPVESGPSASFPYVPWFVESKVLSSDGVHFPRSCEGIAGLAGRRGSVGEGR